MAEPRTAIFWLSCGSMLALHPSYRYYLCIAPCGLQEEFDLRPLVSPTAVISDFQKVMLFMGVFM